MSILLRLTGFIFVCLILVGAAPTSKPSSRPTTQPSSKHIPLLYPTAQRILKHIYHQESRKDATCWTTVRMMEHFYAQKPLRFQAAMLKIESSKLLLYRIWRHASSLSPNRILSKKDIDRALPTTLRSSTLHLAPPQAGAPSPRYLKLKRYHKVTENWRLLLSIAMDSLTGSGVFAKGTIDIKPLSPASMYRLTEVSTSLTIKLLETANKLA